MKKLFFIALLLCSLFNTYAQGLLPTDYFVDTSKPNYIQEITEECALTDGRFTTYGNFVCYQKKPIVLATVGSTNVRPLDNSVFRNGEGSIERGGEVKAADLLVNGTQPLNKGYNVWKMDPWDPQDRGTSGNRGSVFEERRENLTDANKKFFYYDSSLALNVRKNYYMDQSTSSKKTTNSSGANSAVAMSKSGSIQVEAGAGVDKIASGSLNTEFKKKIDEAKSQKQLIVVTKEDQMLGTWCVTDAAILSKEFADALIALPNSFSTSNKGDFERFFNEFGTHYAKETDFGGKDYSYRKYSLKTVSKAVTKDASIKVEGKGKVKGVVDINASIATTLSNSSDKSNSSEKDQTIQKTTGDISAKNINSGVPIAVRLRPVSILCKAFVSDRSNWTQKEKAINDAFKYFNNIYKKTPYASSELFIKQSDLDAVGAAASAKVFENGNFDAVCFNPYTKKYYFWRGHNLWVRPQGGQPEWKDYKQEFPQLDLALEGKAGLDAVVFSTAADKYYFFIGNKYWRKEYGGNDVEGGRDGFPLSAWGKGKLSTNKIDYAVWKETNRITHAFDDDLVSGVYYFMSGDKYWSIETVANNYETAKEGSISSGWSGGNRISGIGKGCTAGVYVPSSKKYYFFRNDESLSKPEGRGVAAPVKIKGDWVD